MIARLFRVFACVAIVTATSAYAESACTSGSGDCSAAAGGSSTGSSVNSAYSANRDWTSGTVLNAGQPQGAQSSNQYAYLNQGALPALPEPTCEQYLAPQPYLPAAQLLNNGQNNGQAAQSATQQLSTGQSTGRQSSSISPVPATAQQTYLQSNARPLPPITDFQRYLCKTTNEYLPVYGAKVFAQQRLLAPLPAGSVSLDYVLGVGDTFALRIWGQLDADLLLMVDRSGNVFIPKVGNVQVVGVPFGELKVRLNQAISKVFRNFELAVTMGELKAVSVFVVGQVQQPGSYTLPALSTVMTALTAAGGPSLQGSMRHIEIKRAGKTVRDVDLYDLLLRGDKSQDLLLQAGDVVHVGTVGPQVAIHGGVNVPSVYELRGKESLRELLDWAGGLSLSGLDGKASIERIADQKTRKVDAIELKKADSFALHGGDVVQVYKLADQVENMVLLKGNVSQPLRMPWWEGMHISDLITSRQQLVDPQFWQSRQRPFRQNSAMSLAQTSAQNGREKIGARNTETVRQELRTEQIEINWDYATIERTDADFRTHLVSFDLAKALAKDARQDLVLQPGDVIHIFSKSDIQVPGAKQTRFVRLEGEVRTPGIYEVQRGETLCQLIARIGGLTEDAYLYGAEFNRESVKESQRDAMDKLADELEQGAQQFASAQAQNAVSEKDVQAAQLTAGQQSSWANKLRNAEVSGRIVLGLGPDARELNALPDVSLEDGDRFFVPGKSATINVVGSVFNKNASYLYRNGAKVDDYVALAGGPTRTADKGSVYVIRADGSVISEQQYTFRSVGGARVLPGDTIIVPEKLDRTTFVKNLMDWTQILANFGTGAAAIKVLGQ